MISYIKYILNILLQFTYTNNFYILIGLNLLAITSFYLLYKYQPKTKDLKIKYFKLNTLLILIYITIFIILIIKARYEYLGKTIELIFIYDIIKQYWILYPLILQIFIIFIIANFMIILLKLKKFFHKQICKRYLYEYFTRNKKAYQENKKSWFVNINDKFGEKWSQNNIINKITSFMLIKPYCVFMHTSSFKPIKKIVNILHFLLTYIAIIIFILVFLYDCFYNNFTLHFVFLYLPIYFCLQLWSTSTKFLNETNKYLNAILYEIYYDTDNVLYLNISENEFKIFNQYIESHLRCFSHDLEYDKSPLEIKIQKHNDILEFPEIFILHRQYRRIKNTKIFHNKYLQESYEVVDSHKDKYNE